MRAPDGTTPPSPQLPGWLAPLDDPWGVTWRIFNLARRVDLGKTARFARALARPPRHGRPVFVVGTPRSGTTLAFRWLRESRVLGSLEREGHDMWRAFHHPRYTGWDSDHVGPGRVRRGERRFVHAYLAAHFREERFVEKTPENSLRVPHLLELFPDAIFVVMKRDPRRVINSLINGWRDPDGRFRSYFVPEDLDIPGHPHRRMWCFALVRGWRELTSAPVPEIAFEQWRQCVVALARDRGRVPAERWVEVALEDLHARPEAVARRVYAAAALPDAGALDEVLRRLLRHPVNALGPRDPDRWRRENGPAIEALLPRIAEVAAEAGYRVDPRTGEVALTG